MLLLLSLLAAAGPSGWVEFDRRVSGFGESPFEYDAGSVRRRGTRVRVRYRYTLHTSGVIPYSNRIGVEIDCVRRTSRDFSTTMVGGWFVRGQLAVRQLPPVMRATPIAPGSPPDLLARRLCQPAPVPAP
jgi:hypothetical protein